MTSRGWYVVAALLFAAGGIGAGGSLWSGVPWIRESFVRILVPGSGEVTLDRPGTYMVFDERDPVTEHISVMALPLNGMSVTISDEADGSVVTTRPPKMKLSYTANGRHAVPVVAFDATHPGRYRLTAAYSNGRNMPKTVMAVDVGLLSRILQTIGRAFVFGTAGGLLGLAVLLITAFSRHSPRRAAAG